MITIQENNLLYLINVDNWKLILMIFKADMYRRSYNKLRNDET
jgi:hypothetical protein